MNFWVKLKQKIIATIFVVFSVLFSCKVYAERTNEAELIVNLVGNSIINIVDNESSISQKQYDLKVLMNEHADLNTISRAALGSSWRNLDKYQRNAFVKAFSNYLIKKYGSQFSEFSGAKMIISKSSDVGKRGVLVFSRFMMPGSTPIAVNWQLWDGTGNLKLIDIIIEEISMLTMEREEIKNRFQKNNRSVTKLIEDLNSINF